MCLFVTECTCCLLESEVFSFSLARRYRYGSAKSFKPASDAHSDPFVVRHDEVLYLRVEQPAQVAQGALLRAFQRATQDHVVAALVGAEDQARGT